MIVIFQTYTFLLSNSLKLLADQDPSLGACAHTGFKRCLWKESLDLPLDEHLEGHSGDLGLFVVRTT